MILIGIAGGTGSGKTTVVKKICKRLSTNNIIVIAQDNYYKDQSHLPMEQRHELNFDHPDAVEFSLLRAHLSELKAGKAIQMPSYSYLTCSRSQTTTLLAPQNVMIVEGMMVLTNKDLLKLLDIKIFVDAEPDDRLARIIKRDIAERGRELEAVLQRYYATVKPMHQQYIEPSKRAADIIIPQGGENLVAIDLLSSTIEMKLQAN